MCVYMYQWSLYKQHIMFVYIVMTYWHILRYIQCHVMLWNELYLCGEYSASEDVWYSNWGLPEVYDYLELRWSTIVRPSYWTYVYHSEGAWDIVMLYTGVEYGKQCHVWVQYKVYWCKMDGIVGDLLQVRLLSIYWWIISKYYEDVSEPTLIVCGEPTLYICLWRANRIYYALSSMWETLEGVKYVYGGTRCRSAYPAIMLPVKFCEDNQSNCCCRRGLLGVCVCVIPPRRACVLC